MDTSADRQKRRKKSIDFKKVVVSGDLDVPRNIGKKSLRVFISSTFKDTQLERNYLMKEIYPGLRRFCEEHGLELYIMDLRWGIRDLSTNDHMTTEICLSEIEKCYTESIPGPCFVFLSGNRYGHRALPRVVDATEFEIILDDIKGDSAREFVLDWYKKDLNAIPPEYVLQPISTHVKGFDTCKDEVEKYECLNTWKKHEEKLQRVLGMTALSSLKLSEKEKIQWKISVTENEVRHGILKKMDASRRCFVLKRDIIVDSNTLEVDDVVKDFYDTESEPIDKIRQAVDFCNVPSKKFDVRLGESGLEGEHVGDYLQDFGKAFKSLMNEMIKGALELMPDMDELTSEVITHTSFCLKRAQHFYARDSLIEEALTYFRSAENAEKPLLVYGDSGVGKTSLMAKLAATMKEQVQSIPGCIPVVVTRFCGITPQSSSIHSVLNSICKQILHAYNREELYSLLGNKKQDRVFRKLLTLASELKPLYIFIDSLDQLSDVVLGQFNFRWLKGKLPCHVFLVVSCLQDDSGCLNTLKTLKIPKSNFLEVSSLSISDTTLILKSWLAYSKRTLTEEQFRYVFEAATDCTFQKPSALRLRLLFDIAVKWTSFQEMESIPACVSELIKQYLIKLEEEHGQLLVMYMFGLLCASRFGLSENDLLEILSCCEEVLDSVLQYHKPPIRKMPHVVFTRLKSNLGDFLVERGVHGKGVLAWYHRQFLEAAKEKYFKDMHEGFSDILKFYFSGALHKKFADRQVSPQPLFWLHKQDETVRFNVQQLNELPHVALHCSFPLSAVYILCNFKFIAAKLEAGLSRELLRDFSEACQSVNSIRLQIYERFLLSEIHFLQHHPRYILQQAFNYPNESIIHQEAVKYIHCPSLVIPWSPSFLQTRLIQHVNKPTGPKPCFLTLEENPLPIMDLKFVDRYLLCCQGNSVLIWDTRQGELKKDVMFPDDVCSAEIISQKSSVEFKCSQGQINEVIEADIAFACKNAIIYIWRIKFEDVIQTKFLHQIRALETPVTKIILAFDKGSQRFLVAGISYLPVKEWHKDNCGEVRLWILPKTLSKDDKTPSLHAQASAGQISGNDKEGFISSLTFILSNDFIAVGTTADMIHGFVSICSLPDLKPVWILSSISRGLQALFPKFLDVYQNKNKECMLLISSKDEYGLVSVTKKSNHRVIVNLLGRYRGSPAVFLPEKASILCANEEKALIFQCSNLFSSVKHTNHIVMESKWEEIGIMRRSCSITPNDENEDGTRIYTYSNFRTKRKSSGSSQKKHYNSELQVTLKNILIGHSSCITEVAVQNEMIATGSSEGVIKVWDLKVLNTLSFPQAHVSPVTVCAKLGDSNISLTSSSYPEDCVKLWNSETGNLITSIPGISLTFMIVSLDAATVCWGVGKGSIYVGLISDFQRRLLELRKVKDGDKIVCPGKPFNSCAFSSDSNFLCRQDDTKNDTIVIDVTKNAWIRLPISRYENETVKDGSIFLYETNKLVTWISTKSDDNNFSTTIFCWMIVPKCSVGNQKVKSTELVTKPGLYNFSYLQQRSHGRSSSESENCEIVRLLKIIKIEDTGCFTSICNVPNSFFVFTCVSGGMLEKRDFETFELLTRTQAHKQDISNIKSSPDGRYLATCCQDGWINVWNTADLSKVGGYYNGASVTSLDIFYNSTGQLFVNAGDSRGQFIILKVLEMDTEDQEM